MPTWKSATVVERAPTGARYICDDRGWSYYVLGATIYARRAI